MGIGRNREQAAADQRERDRINRQLREQAARERGPGPRKFSWQTEPGKFSWQGGSGQQDSHRYETCKDEDCPKFPCRVYREGRREGHDEGFTAGYTAGFPDGVAACPLPHQG